MQLKYITELNDEDLDELVVRFDELGIIIPGHRDAYLNFMTRVAPLLADLSRMPDVPTRIFARTWIYALAERLRTSWYASRHGDLSQPVTHEVTLTFIGSTALAATMTRSDTQRRQSITLQ